MPVQSGVLEIGTNAGYRDGGREIMSAE